MSIQFYEQLNLFYELLKLKPFINYQNDFKKTLPENAMGSVTIYVALFLFLSDFFCLSLAANALINLTIKKFLLNKVGLF